MLESNISLLIWSTLSGFAVFRVAQLFVMDAGPFSLFKRFRQFMGRQAAKDQGPGLRWTIAELFQCTYCLGLWLAVIPAVFLANSPPEFFLLWFAIAGIQTYLQHATTMEL